MTTSVPKNILIRKALHIVPEPDIRSAFGFPYSQELFERLNTLLKSELESFLRSFPGGNEAIRVLELRYPYDMPAIFYLVKVSPDLHSLKLPQLVKELIDNGREGGLLNPNKSVRVMYIDKIGETTQGFYEIALIYEQKHEFRLGDPPHSDQYGDILETYSLERSFIWLIDNYSHGVVCCSGMAGLKATLDFSRRMLGVGLSLPNMTLDIYSRIRGESDASGTTLAGFPPGTPTISVYAPNVEGTEIYKLLSERVGGEQISGFFQSTDNSYFSSFGISRRYARIWTPWHYSKPYLISAISEIIDRTESELANEYKANVPGYISYFSGVPIEVEEGKPLTGRARTLFQRLLESIAQANKIDSKEIEIDNKLLYELIILRSRLKLQVCTQFECADCGGGLGICPDCRLPYEVSYDDDTGVKIFCKSCKLEIDPDHQNLCQCGAVLEITFLDNHIQIFPEPTLYTAISKFIDEHLDEILFEGSFFINGLILKLTSIKIKSEELPDRIELNGLQFWRSRAHFHLRQSREVFYPLLNMTKEKCRRNGNPPNREVCKACLESTISEEQARTKDEVCLPRIMGIAIDEGFDGIHHKYEIADVKYVDNLHESDVRLEMGIHLKSRTTTKSEQLGRSVYAIKSLYTQALYSAYQSLTSESIDFDVIGISIPNQIHPTVIDSIQLLLNQLGFSFLAIEEDDWLKIIDAAFEKMVVDDTRV